MFKITNVETLGSDYTITDQNGKLIKTIQVVTHTDILNAALGAFTLDFGTVSAYLEKSTETLIGYDKIDPNKILWYATYDEEVVLSDVIEYAIQHGYDKIILEHLEDFADFN